MMASNSSIILSFLVYASLVNSILAKSKYWTTKNAYNLDSLDKPISFKEYVLKFHKHYGSQKEYDKRQAIFEANIKDMILHNRKHDKGQLSHRRGINQFTDLTTEEFQSRNHGDFLLFYIYLEANHS